jgi:hypothetical protein
MDSLGRSFLGKLRRYGDATEIRGYALPTVQAELNRLVYRAMRSGEEAADVCDLLARMLVIGPKLDADPNYQPEEFEGGGLVEIAAGAAAIAGLKIVAAAHNLSFMEAALYLQNEWVGAKSLAADFFRGHGHQAHLGGVPRSSAL